MSVEHQNNDRRKDGRLKLKPGLFVFMGRNPGKLASVRDWSETGLGLEYVSRDTIKGKKFRLDMFTSEDLYTAITDFDVELIYDKKVGLLPSDGPLEIRNCGIKFKGLDLYQQNLLENFVNAHVSAGG